MGAMGTMGTTMGATMGTTGMVLSHLSHHDHHDPRGLATRPEWGQSRGQRSLSQTQTQKTANNNPHMATATTMASLVSAMRQTTSTPEVSECHANMNSKL